MNEFFPLFPITVARYKYQRNDSVKSAIEQMIVDQPHRTNRQGAKLYFEKSKELFLDDPRLADFKAFVLDSVNMYMQELVKLKGDMIITDAWLNCTGKGFLEDTHNHANSFISGTYYVNFDSTKHSNLEFYKNPLAYSSAPLLECDLIEVGPFNATKFTLDLSEGDLVLWPSHLHHGFAEENKGDGRISIAINFMPAVISNGMFSFRASRT